VVFAGKFVVRGVVREVSEAVVDERVVVTVREAKVGRVSPGVKVSAVDATLSLTVSAFILVTIQEGPIFSQSSLWHIVLIPSLPFNN